MNINFISGENIYDFHLIPTIKFTRYFDMRFLTFEWLKRYVGFSWERNDKEET